MSQAQGDRGSVTLAVHNPFFELVGPMPTKLSVVARAASTVFVVLVALAACERPSTAPTDATAPTSEPSPSFDVAPFVGSRVVVAGGKSTCAMRGDGTVLCWGEASYGATASLPDAFTAVGAGFFHYCGIRPDQSLACWGYGSDNRTLAPVGAFNSLAVGQEHNCALRTDNTAVCWGFGGDGRGSPPAGPYKLLSSGWYHSCGIRPDDTIACWGQNGSGQATPPAGTFRSVSGGGTHTCAIRTDGTLACFGASPSPPVGTFTQVSAGSLGHTCAIRTDGTLGCWGANSHGQATPPTGQFVQVSAGWQHTCAVRADQRIMCWGLNTNGSTVVPAEFVNRPPVANAGGPYSVLVNQPAFLSASGSSDPDNDALTYAWDFDDDNIADATTVSVTRAFATAGSYTVSLRVTDPSGAFATTTVAVNVRAPNLTAGLPNTCGHQITGIAFDGAYYYVGEGQFSLYQCITRYDANGGYVDHKVFPIDMRGLHYVPATGKLVTRHYNGRFSAIDYAAGTHAILTTFVPAPEQVQAAADPNGNTFWFVNSPSMEQHRISDNGLATSFPVTTNNAFVVGVSNKWLFTVQGTTVNVYDKATGASRGTQTLPSGLGCYTGWGFGASATGDRLMYASDCVTAKVLMTGLVENTPPIARPGGPYSVLVNQPVFVDGSPSSDPDGDALTYAWDFDGDAVTDATTASASHAFTATGIHPVTLTVRDPSGATGTSTATVTVRAPDLAAGLPNTCGHQITGIAFDGAYYYVGEGQFSLFQCITRYDASGGYVDHKVFAIDMRGLHYVPATGKLVTRRYNGQFYSVDYATGTFTDLTTYAPAPEQVQAAADPAGSSFWFVNGASAESHRLADNGLIRSIPVITNNPFVIAVSNRRIFTVQGTTVNVYDKATGDTRGTVTLPSVLGCYTGWGFGASSTGDRVMYASNCSTAKVIMTGLVENLAPIARAGGPYSVLVNQPVFANGSPSSDPDGDLLTYAWDFNGDAISDATTASATHAFPSTGTYTITLTVRDPSGATATSAATVTVRAPDLDAGLPNTCGHQITGVAFDGARYYVAEGQFGLYQCITRFDANGGYLDHKVFAIDMRGLHFVPATGKLVTRHYNGRMFAVDYAAGTFTPITSFAPAPEQVQAAADPAGTTFWFVNGTAAEEHRLSDNGLVRSFPVTTNNPFVIAVSNTWIFTVQGTTVNIYDKGTGAPRGTLSLPSGLGCYTQWGLGSSSTGDRLLWARSCTAAKQYITGLTEPGATLTGNSVDVKPVDAATGVEAPIQLTFSSVVARGITTVDEREFDGSASAPPPPTGFRLGTPDTYYDIRTTATFGGAIKVCIDYSSVSYGNESELRLMHRRADGVWEDATTSLDTNANIICGSVFSLSPFVVAEANRAPTVTEVALPSEPLPLGQVATISATFTDGNPRDVHTASVGWDDGGAGSAGAVTESAGTGAVSASRTFTSAGVYTIGVTVSDGLVSGSRSSVLDVPGYVVVYDAAAGFVTGGGWIMSPEGACHWTGCLANGSTTGKATFGFVSRYTKGANVPDGSTEFQFKAGGLTFSSTSYDWLVVAGSRAQYKGVGTINGAGGYRFLITAIDGQLHPSGGSDRFRIKIWEQATSTVVYDNQRGESDDSSSSTALGGGSIVIHR